VGWIVFLPAYVYLALRERHTTLPLSVFGPSTTNFGAESSLYRYGGLFEDDVTDIATGYATETALPLSTAAAVAQRGLADTDELDLLRCVEERFGAPTTGQRESSLREHRLDS